MANDVVATYRQLEADLAELIGPSPWTAAENLRLERMHALLDRLDHPERAFAAIHIGGTSGKGSTAMMTAAILTAAGYRTGLHVSPHLQILNERHQIDCRPAPTTLLAELFARMRPAITAVAEETPYGRPSYFEAQVALSWLLFRHVGVDVAVVEVGLGGTLDATNALPAEIAVLTNVGLDHTDILGDTVEAIAGDKAGIIKPGQIVVSGVTQPAVRTIVAERCAGVGARLWQLGETFNFAPDEQAINALTVRLPGGTLHDLRVGPPGGFQLTNAALAVAASTAWRVRAGDDGLPEMAVRAGLAAAEIPARLEQMQDAPLVILDGAHNPDKIAAAARAVAPLAAGRRRVGLLALKSDKDATAVLPHVLANIDELVTTAFYVKGLWRPADPAGLAALAHALDPALPVRVIADPLTAVRAVLAEAAPDDFVWITGSLYLAGDVREHWRPKAALLAAAEKSLVATAGAAGTGAEPGA